MTERKIRRLRTGRMLKVPVNGEQVPIDIDEDIDLDHRERGPLKVRCEGPNGLKTGSVVGMLQQLGLSAEQILLLRAEGVLEPRDFNNIGAPWEAFEPELYYSTIKPRAEPRIETYSPPQITREELANFDHLGPEQLIDLLERVQRRVQWEVLKQESREQIDWFLENLDRARIAPRCAHMKPDGSTCGSPAVKGENFCHWHSETRALRRARKESENFELPVLEDRFGLQLGIMRVCDLLTSKAIDPYTARILFQGLRLAERTLNKASSLPANPKRVPKEIWDQSQ